jgi:signal transduction histidine kinase
VFQSSRLRVLALLALALGIGALFAAASVLYILRLEKESKVRFDEIQRLSARLVDAQEQERRAISRELHDEVGQSLNALLVDLGNLAAVTPRESAEAHQLLETAKSLANHSVKALRNMALLLRPSMLDDFGLIPALHWQAREVSRRTGMRIDVNADEATDGLPEEYRTCIYRVVQEALHNSSRHAEAKRVRISVSQEAERILLTVQDDGKGFQAAGVRGLGLIGMEERVKHLNGKFQVSRGLARARS